MTDEDSDFNIVTHLKALSSNSNHSKHTEYPYDNSNDFFDTQDLTDSSDEEGAATVMQAVSDSDNEVEIDPYWRGSWLMSSKALETLPWCSSTSQIWCQN